MGWYENWKEGKPINSAKNESTPQRRLRCEVCNSDDLAFVAEYHKELKLRNLRNILIEISKLLGLFIIAFILYSIITQKDSEIFFNIITLGTIFYLLLKIVIIDLTRKINTRESHTHVRIICRVCAYSWVID